MKLASITVSRLVVTEHGTGFMDEKRREMRTAFGIHVAPEPQDVRPATKEEAMQFFAARGAFRAGMTEYYNRADARGASTGD